MSALPVPAICATNIAASKTSAAEHVYISCNVSGKRDEPPPNASLSTSTKQYDQNTSYNAQDCAMFSYQPLKVK